MKIDTELRPNPTFHVTLELDVSEMRQLEAWMSNSTGPTAPESHKELLVAIRKAMNEGRVK